MDVAVVVVLVFFCFTGWFTGVNKRYGFWTQVGQRNDVLYRGPDLSREVAVLGASLASL